MRVLIPGGDPASTVAAGRQHGVLAIVASYENSDPVPKKLFPTHRGTLAVRYRSDGHVNDRYVLRMPDETDETEGPHFEEERFSPTGL